jgi:uncharacterized protein (DUF983 family)
VLGFAVSLNLALAPNQRLATFAFSGLRTCVPSCRPFDIFDQLLAEAFACSSCLSHLPLLSGYDEPKTLSYQISAFGPIGANVSHFKETTHLGISMDGHTVFTN